MARKKVEPTLIVKNWNEADNTLRKIGELQILEQVRESRAQLAINEIRENLKGDRSPLEEEIKKLELGLKSFCEAERQKRDFKSRVLTFGAVFFRQRTSLKLLKGFKWKDIAETLARMKLTRYLKITKSIKKDELRSSKLSDAKLLLLGVERHSERPFTYEINEEKVELPDIADEASAPRAVSA